MPLMTQGKSDSTLHKFMSSFPLNFAFGQNGILSDSSLSNIVDVDSSTNPIKHLSRSVSDAQNTRKIYPRECESHDELSNVSHAHVSEISKPVDISIARSSDFASFSHDRERSVSFGDKQLVIIEDEVDFRTISAENRQRSESSEKHLACSTL